MSQDNLPIPRSLLPDITRRDFIGSTLIGAGAALLGAGCPAAAMTGRTSTDWDGYAGVGDYARANGNTWDVITSAHRIRDDAYEERPLQAVDSGEHYDVVIVGSGFGGIAALHRFAKLRPGGRCLLLENHPIFGGHARANEFDVDGYRVSGPQASNNFSVPMPDKDSGYSIWQELGLPTEFEFAEQAGGKSIAFCKGTSPPMYRDELSANIGYFFGKSGWARDVWRNDLKETAWSQRVRQDMLRWRDSKVQYRPDDQEARWLDSMTYADFLRNEMKLDEEVIRYADPIVFCNSLSASSDGISAYAAQLGQLPGVSRFPGRNPAHGDSFISFPGGNAAFLRAFVKAIFPAAIPDGDLATIATAPIDFAAFDVAGASLRMRLNATAVRVEGTGGKLDDGPLTVTYAKNGALTQVHSEAVILAIPAHVARRIVVGLPDGERHALQQFHYGPRLMINVALRNWRFMERLGISVARWFEGFGFYAALRRPMAFGADQPPFHPDKPIVMTWYVPVMKPGLPVQAQGPVARMEMFGTSYAQYESLLVNQMMEMFGLAGFDARRDIAGIVVNRWGHPFFSPQPGFYFGGPGGKSPKDVLRERTGRVAFAHSELGGKLNGSWFQACAEGERAVGQVLAAI